MFKEAVLVIHGFMGEISEVEYLINQINLNSNIDAYAFSLPGHEKYTIKDVKYQDWIKASEDMVNSLKKKYKTIYIIGHSMGGVIASYLATQHKEIKKIILVAPAFMYLDYENFDNIKEIIKNPIKNQDRYKDVTYKMLHTSLSSVLEFKKLVEKYYDTPKEIKCPVLILQGDKDAIVPIKSSNYVYDNVLSKDKFIKIVPNETHSILCGPNKENITKYIIKYLLGGLEWIIAKNSKI